MQLVLSRCQGDKLGIILPETLRQREALIRESLARREPALRHLQAGGYLEVEFSFVPDAYFTVDSEAKRILDRREAGGR